MTNTTTDSYELARTKLRDDAIAFAERWLATLLERKLEAESLLAWIVRQKESVEIELLRLRNES